MPELPEVETICRGLNKLTSGATIKGGEVLLKRTLAYPPAISEFERTIANLTVVFWTRQGKYLLAKLSQGWLGIHLRMTGQLLWIPQDTPLAKHTRIRLFFADNQELRFVDTRTFGQFWYVPSKVSPEKIISGLATLGVEPLSEDFTLDYFTSKLSKSRRKIKTLLLDQTIVAGIGNIYADEALFTSKILPNAIASNLTLTQTETLRKAIIEVLARAIEAGGTTFSDFRQVTGVNGNYGGIAWVYKRNNQPCRVCGTIIQKIKLGGRSTHFCPQCQSIGFTSIDISRN
jgi:formamidopyrimidine-DNA glycosylase